MTAQDILTLVNAGYTRAEIEALEASKDPEPARDPEPEQYPEPERDPEPEQDTEPDWAKALNESIKNLISAVEKSNRATLEQPDEDMNSAVDRVFSEYLNGPDKKKKK